PHTRPGSTLFPYTTLFRSRELIPEFASLGCIFVVSAVESLSDLVLEHLEKGHSREDVNKALEILRGAGIAMRPTFVPFTPWTTIDRKSTRLNSSHQIISYA